MRPTVQSSRSPRAFHSDGFLGSYKLAFRLSTNSDNKDFLEYRMTEFIPHDNSAIEQFIDIKNRHALLLGRQQRT